MLAARRSEVAIVFVDQQVSNASGWEIVLQRVSGYSLDGSYCRGDLGVGFGLGPWNLSGASGFNEVEARPVPAKSQWHSDLGRAAVEM